MTVTGKDAFVPYVDTGVASTPTTRANTTTDYHTLSGVVEKDPERADTKLVVPIAGRPVVSPR
jgi:hypothetical protein